MAEGYAQVLDTAVAATLEAGAILRADFLQPGGPRRWDSEHAPADEEAEATIRSRLLAVTPNWSYRGEETGWQEGGERRHVWLVDPNDGTAAYLRGLRGSAVSIGLLRDREPVLGVVFAFAAPDDDGDLFAWAEGCGSLRRNGLATERAPLPAALSPRVTIAVTPGAPESPPPDPQLFAPALPIPVTSIAYRLALVAAGDVDGAVCLSGPGDWDYAGGHALLRSAGGALVDELGEPVRYTAQGESQTEACFAGSLSVAQELANRFHR
jgi:fructose-1,6-bisphosphatase/inositol monophosphatase family enzyme